MDIAILLFDKLTALDAIGPYDVLNRLPNSTVYFVGEEKRGYKDSYGLTMMADYSIDEITEADILLIPGGAGIDALLDNQALINWIHEVDQTTILTTSVCAGSLLLAEAGLLENKNCTTHWKRKAQMSKYNLTVKHERYVQDGKIITSAGVSAGIDMALYLVGQIAGKQAAQVIQLGIEYNPDPPYEFIDPDALLKENSHDRDHLFH